ncbi:MAG: toprim domain-containing protein [Candidatus Paceibacterota bacterium]
MDVITKLTEEFAKFPGIGPRQARRFVYYLLQKNGNALEILANDIRRLKQEVRLCPSCFRHFIPRNQEAKECDICQDQARKGDSLMVVEKEADFETIERSGVHEGKYFILGGSVVLLDKEPGQYIRTKELLKTIEERAKDGLKEVVLALSTNVEGEETSAYLREALSPLQKKHSFSISELGRGLSTGAELEYSDKETIKNAFQNRRA